MAVRSINASDLAILSETLHYVEHRPALRDASKADVPAQFFARVSNVVAEAMKGSRSGFQSFWSESYRNPEFLPAVGRLLWQTRDWKQLSNSILALLAVQHGDNGEFASVCMKLGSTFFLTGRNPLQEAVTIGSGSRWVQSEGRTSMQYTTPLRQGGKRMPATFEISLRPLQDRNGAFEKTEIYITPRQWVDNVYSLQSANLSVTHNGRPLAFTRNFGWIPLNDTRSFKGSSFRANVALTPLRSSCVSFAIIKGGIHTVFFHPIGLMR